MKKILIIALVLLSARQLVAQPKVKQTITLATYQYAENKRLSNILPLASLLEKETGYHVEAKSYPTIFAFIAAINHKEVDIALINTFGYMLLENAGKANQMKAIAALEVHAAAKDNYKTAIVVPANSKITSFNAIAKLAPEINLKLVAEGSTSGNLVPRLAFTKIGINDAEQSFKSVSYGKTHKLTIEAVASGQTDLAAVGSSEYFSFISKEEQKAKIRLILMSPEIPLGPVLINKELPSVLIKQITSILLHLHAENPKELLAVKEGWSEAKQAEKYIAISPSYYDPFKNQLGKQQDLMKIIKQFAN